MDKTNSYDKLLMAYQQIRDNDLATEIVVKTSIGDYPITNREVINFIVTSLICELKSKMDNI